MQQVTSTAQSGAYTTCVAALLSSLLLVACDNAALQLCGEYACVAYQSECGETSNCNEPRQCEAAGSIRDRSPRIINQLRQAQRSCAATTNTSNSAILTWDETLASVSVSHARDMALNRFESFVGSDGLSTKDRAMLAGITSATVFENITAGPQTAAEAINTWLDVSTDCQQLISSETIRIGMACAAPNSSNEGPYWSVLLAGPEAQ